MLAISPFRFVVIVTAKHGKNQPPYKQYERGAKKIDTKIVPHALIRAPKRKEKKKKEEGIYSRFMSAR